MTKVGVPFFFWIAHFFVPFHPVLLYVNKKASAYALAYGVGKLPISRRYNRLPLLRSSPGGFIRSWPYRTYPYTVVSELQFRRDASRIPCKDRHFFSPGNYLPHFILQKAPCNRPKSAPKAPDSP